MLHAGRRLFRLVQSTDSSSFTLTDICTIQIHNDGLKNGQSSKKYIKLDGPNNSGDSQGFSADKLMTTAIGSYQRLNNKRGPVAVTLIHVYNSLHRHAKAIDVFVQCQPEVGCLVWGSVRILLQVRLRFHVPRRGLQPLTEMVASQVVHDEQRACQIASDGTLEILRHADRWEQILAISDLLGAGSIRNALVGLYVRVLGFLVSSTQWMKRGSIGQIFLITDWSLRSIKTMCRLQLTKLTYPSVQRD